MTIVIDASIALSWCFEDEASEETDAIAAEVMHNRAVVPALFHLEIGNSLLQAERRGRISADAISERLDLLSMMPIETDQRPITGVTSAIILLARQLNLTAYDATYLELALHRGATLATKDRALVIAASRVGIDVLSTAG